MKLTLGQVADWIHAEGDFTTNSVADGYSIDSRTLGAGDLFFAVRGERFDGHDFVEAALANGAVAAVVSNRWLAPDEMDGCKLLRVPEGEYCVLHALQTLAKGLRRAWGGRVIGVTGSAGKTTTKEAVALVLATRFNVLKSEGNLNNHFGLPLQLLRLEPGHEVAVLEMGMNHAGEIAALAQIAEPDWAVVSNVGPVHVGNFPDGIDGVARAKYELVEALPPDGLAILNADDERVAAFGRGLGERAVLYGTADGAAVRAEEIGFRSGGRMEFTVAAAGARAHVEIALSGRHNVLNALAAIAAGLRSGIPLPECARALSGLAPSERRGSTLTWRGATLINDCYNSNPIALDGMVDVLLASPAARHIVVAGEMLELGAESAGRHRACGERMARLGVSLVVGVRGDAAAIVAGAQSAGGEACFVEDAAEAGRWLAANLREGDRVLLKASRGVRLEEALAALQTADA